MKCVACGVENIYGAKTCKACGSTLGRATGAEAATRAQAAMPPAPIAYPANTGAGQVQAAAIEASADAEGPGLEPAEPHAMASGQTGRLELTFIPYTSNGPFNHFVRGLRLALDFQGRTARAGFWFFTLFQVLVVLVLHALSPSLGDLAVLLMLVPSLAIGVRRLHDTSRSGWWLLASLVPLLNLVLIYFAVQASDPKDNAWGPRAVAQG